MEEEVLHVKRPFFQAMLAHLQANYPLEACGLLAGTANQARHWYAIDNRLASPVAYEMEPRQQLQAMLDLEAQGWEMVAIVHSHPAGPERPSPTDIAQAYYPDCVYVIVSLADRSQPVVRGFRIENGRFHEIRINVE
ncbi:MAG: M67 family metallopeptidase [Anaerolineae bacterium]|nr:M67 family metallopeptidase [Anaerolineae bacterium]